MTAWTGGVRTTGVFNEDLRQWVAVVQEGDARLCASAPGVSVGQRWSAPAR